jgi:hypothetical protein
VTTVEEQDTRAEQTPRKLILQELSLVGDLRIATSDALIDGPKREPSDQ